jgi:hypothetical protein
MLDQLTLAQDQLDGLLAREDLSPDLQDLARLVAGALDHIHATVQDHALRVDELEAGTTPPHTIDPTATRQLRDSASATHQRVAEQLDAYREAPKLRHFTFLHTLGQAVDQLANDLLAHLNDHLILTPPEPRS